MNIEKQLAMLQLKEDARDVLNSYCRALDTDDLDLLGSILHSEVVLNRPPDQPVTGRSAVIDFFRGALEHKVDSRKHFATNPAVTVNDDGTARVTSYFYALHHVQNTLSCAWGEYLVDVARNQDRLLITGLQIRLDMPIAPIKSMLGE
jgi:hypothetical protein